MFGTSFIKPTPALPSLLSAQFSRFRLPFTTYPPLSSLACSSLLWKSINPGHKNLAWQWRAVACRRDNLMHADACQSPHQSAAISWWENPLCAGQDRISPDKEVLMSDQ
jgi:hypothetical protein